MTNSKTTKKALLSSSISILLCFAMLIGSTFAWFTDNVATTNNIITAGNLDVELYYQNSETSDWTAVYANTNVFKKDTLWEPGHAEVVQLRVVNAGTLALKYQLGVNVVSETGSINVAGNEFKLSDYIKYSIVEGNPNYGSSKDAADAVDATANPLRVTYTSESIKLLPKDDSADTDEKIVTMVVYMPSTVGNEANYANGEAVPTINLGINLVATQESYEKDSFGDLYDNGAIYDMGKPVAKTNILTNMTTIKNLDGVEVLGKNLLVDTRGNINGDLFDQPINLDTAYQFQPTLKEEEAELSEYKDWHADFVVYVDKDIPADCIALAGYYDAWCSINNDKWVALTSNGEPIGKNTEIRLVEMLGATVSYEELSIYGNDGIGFLCGAKKLNDTLPSGTTLNVELRLYEATGNSINTETGEYITVQKYSYTFE